MPKMIPKPYLEKWAIKKFIEQQSTMELMVTAENNCDMTALAIVALLEVKPEDRYLGMAKDEIEYTESCHNYLRSLEQGADAARNIPLR